MSKERELGQRIHRLRAERGWTLDQLAKESDLTKGFLSQIENGLAPRPSGQVLLALARSLGASVDWLLTGDDAEPTGRAEPLAIAPELAELAIERGWTARKVFQIVGASNALLARRSDKPRHVLRTKAEWLAFVERLEPYLDE